MWLIGEIWMKTFKRFMLRMLKSLSFFSSKYNILSDIVQRNELISLENSTGEPKVSIIKK